MAEAYAARYSGGSTAVGCACTCSADAAEGDIPPSHDLSHHLDVAALDEVATVPFMDNELFVFIRELEQLRQQEETEKSHAGDVEISHGETYRKAETSLEAVYTSQAFRILAEQSMDKGLTQEAANQFDEAYREGSSYLPDRCPRPRGVEGSFIRLSVPTRELFVFRVYDRMAVLTTVNRFGDHLLRLLCTPWEAISRP